MKNLRILFVNGHGTDPSFGGTERYVAALAAGVEERGGHARVLAAFPGGSAFAADRTRVLHGSDWRESELRRLSNHAADVVSRPARARAAAIEWARPDVVHTGNLPGISTGIWEDARRAGIPVVHTLHDYYLLCPRTTLLRRDGAPCRPHPLLCGLRARRLARWAPAVSAVIGVSRFVLERHAHLFPAARLEVIPHPFDPPARPARPPRDGLAVVGYIGALEVVKGVDRLLAARLDTELRVAGDGRLRTQVEAAAGVRYEGVVTGERKANFLAACDLGVVPSVWDEPGAPPFTVLDWLFAGRPVLASGRGGLVEARAELGGVIEIEPTAAGIAAGVARLRAPGVWRAAVASVHVGCRPRQAWLDAHERVYRAVIP